MKQYTDTERLDAMIANVWRIDSDDDGTAVYVINDFCECFSGLHPTPRAAIDDAMNREAERRANEALKNMTGGNAG